MIDGPAGASAALHQFRRWVDPEAFHYRMRTDQRWAAAVRFSCEHGIPLSVFFGRVVGPDEPQWLPYDTDIAVAYTQWEAGICPGCGLHRLDWPHEHDETYKGEITICFGCVELEDTKATIPKDTSDARRRAMRIYLIPRSGPERELLEARERGEIDLDDLPGFT